MFLEPNSISLLLCKTNNSLIISKPKIATKYLSLYFDSKFKEISIDSLGNININKEELDDEYINDICEVWKDILDKKWKGKIIVLFRNPYQRFLTGFVQDYLNTLRNYRSFASSGTITYGFFYNWFLEKGMSVTNIGEFVEWASQNNRPCFTDKEKKFEEIYSRYTLLHLRCLAETSVYTGHNQQYLSTILNLLLLDILNIKENMFYDIDSNGMDLYRFLNNNGIRKISHDKNLEFNSNDFFKKYVNETIKENNLSIIIEQCLSLEQNAYDVLRHKLEKIH